MVIVSVVSGEVLCIGDVPIQHQPPHPQHAERDDLLWAIRGAGTNFGVVISIVLKEYPVRVYTV